MSNKHLACVVLTLIIGAMGYGTLTMKNKLAAASEQRDQAERAALSATNTRKGAQIDLDKRTRATEDLRDYLAEWQPYLSQTKKVEDAERMFNQKVTQGALTLFRLNFQSAAVDSESTIPSAHGARLIFEDDYHDLLTWVGSLESTLPTCRIASCRITKGQSGNDIKMDLLAQVPLAHAATEQ